ncbi:DegT/DnrJ/EryC1/StrS family aminotransferase [Haloplanus halobius]|uniref:DegT/DnrJ/EryC1/StrS family aminotransferase n=1 Tax=Haloplanus halobius TaxID=2934938 RepID=UPI00200D06A5|nr:DegT/DnrJ/EryC1/StrS family aminotransferase [Haloplanus sp. XH21]
MEHDGYRVPYARATYGQEEREAVNEVLDHPESLVGGEFTSEFQDRVSTLFGKEHGVMVNSGSSANLLAIELLDAEPGSEVITPLVTFSTTVAPIIQKGLVPTFVDVGVGDYLLDIGQVREAITDDTVAIVAPSLLGNVPNYAELRSIADEHDLQLIEDSADTIGAKIQGQPTGEFTDISTTSFYGSHVITSFGTGGMIAVDNDESMKRLKKLRGWGRSSAADETNDIEERLDRILGDVHYDSKFVFDEIGYNFLPTEASAAFGVEQVRKLDSFIKRRQEVFATLDDFFSEYREWFVLPEQRSDVETCWLAYPLTIRPEAPFDRRAIVRHLEMNGIQTRSLWSGNLLKHPGFERIDARLPFDDYPEANRIMADSFVIGAHQSMSDEDVVYIEETFEDLFVDY